jgi:hypothetical protein
MDKLMATDYKILLTNDFTGVLRNWMNFYMSTKGINPGHYIELELGMINGYQGSEDVPTREVMSTMLEN